MNELKGIAGDGKPKAGKYYVAPDFDSLDVVANDLAAGTCNIAGESLVIHFFKKSKKSCL